MAAEARGHCPIAGMARLGVCACVSRTSARACVYAREKAQHWGWGPSWGAARSRSSAGVIPGWPQLRLQPWCSTAGGSVTLCPTSVWPSVPQDMYAVGARVWCGRNAGGGPRGAGSHWKVPFALKDGGQGAHRVGGWHVLSLSCSVVLQAGVLSNSSQAARGSRCFLHHTTCLFTRGWGAQMQPVRGCHFILICSACFFT